MPIHNLLDHGAAGDGRSDDTGAIQRAIDACAAAGGGTVLAPAGHIFLASTLVMKAQVDLHVERGAVLRARGDWADYPAELGSDIISGGLVDEPELPRRAFLIAFRADGISLSGGGVIDGNGRSFVAEDLGPIYRMRGEQQYRERPFTVFFIGCRNVTVRELTLRDGAFWTLRLTGCEDVLIHGLRIDNDLKLPNNDGIDLDRCRNVRVSDCHISAGDDAICLKTCRGAAAFGPCENITVTGCTVVSTSSALKIGNECSAPIRNVVFQACVVCGTHRGLSIHPGETGDVENILFSDIVVETRLFDTAWWGRGEPIYISVRPWTGPVGAVRHVRYRNILCRSENGVVIAGADPGRIEDVLLDNVRVELAKWSRVPGGWHDLRPGDGPGLVEHPTAGFFLHNAGRVTLRHCETAWGPEPPDYFRHALEAHGVSELILDDFQGQAADPAHYEAIVIDPAN